MPLKVMQLGPTRYRGGVAVAIKQLSVGLAKAGNEVMLVGNGGTDLGDVMRAGVQYLDLGWVNNAGLLKATPVIRYLIKSFRPDVVHVHGRGPALACRLAGRQADWFTLHNTHLTDQAIFFDFGPLRRLLSPLGRRVFALNEESVEYLKDALGVARRSIEIVPNGVDCEHFIVPSKEQRQAARKFFGVESGQTLVVFIGRLHESKRPEIVVELANRLRDLKAVAFAIVGEGAMQDQIKRQIERLGLTDICHAYPWMDPRQAYWAADLLLLPSLYEGFGLVAAEALACGCPVVRTKTGGYSTTNRDGVTGWATEIDSEAFMAICLDVVREPSILSLMRSSARSWAESHLALDKQVERTIQAYVSSHRPS